MYITGVQYGDSQFLKVNIDSIPYAVQCLLVAYFIHNTLYLLLSYHYLVPPHFPLPSGNHIASLYLSLLLFCYVSLFVVFLRFHI